MSQQLIKEYFEAFARRDIETITSQLTENVVLQDPAVKVVSGKDAVLAVYRDIFSAHPEIHCETKRVYTQGELSYAVEFSLVLKTNEGAEVHIDGMDCIECQDGKISSLRAYLDVKG